MTSRYNLDWMWMVGLKGPYTQQVAGVLPCILTDDVVTAHLKSSGKHLQLRKCKK